MDDRTSRYYESLRREQAASYESAHSGIADYFPLAFPPGSRVLDLGCGTARDTAQLAREGHVAYGVEPAQRMRELAVEHHPELRYRILAGDLPDGLPGPDDLGGPFDGVVCSAVLQHLDRQQLFDAVFAMKALLAPRGRLLVSIPDRRHDLDSESRDEQGRLFNNISANELELLFERAGFDAIGRWDNPDGLGRQGRDWITSLFTLRSTGVSRPLDLIEAILRRDRKVATYKLALIRALAEIATTQSHQARWRPDGFVGIPIEPVAERWIEYYWPFFQQTELFVPQMNGEWGAKQHKVAFADELSKLVQEYRQRGGLPMYIVDRKSGSLSPRAGQHYRSLLLKLKNTIRAGPVTYAGGSLESGPIFSYERGVILVQPDLWRELSLMGHWIRDSLILRWGEKCSQLSRSELPPQEVVRILMTTPDIDRETLAARQVYEALPTKECVWTGAALRGTRFDVDHVIAFSLWRNNDLWNLLPAASTVNRSKSDQLPTKELLQRRRSIVLDYWSLLRGAHPRRFHAEAELIAGQSEPTLPALFNVMRECIEVTALQRGCTRWDT
jgi:SAM-dependent methyltransferase